MRRYKDKKTERQKDEQTKKEEKKRKEKKKKNTSRDILTVALCPRHTAHPPARTIGGKNPC